MFTGGQLNKQHSAPVNTHELAKETERLDRTFTVHSSWSSSSQVSNVVVLTYFMVILEKQGNHIDVRWA